MLVHSGDRIRVDGGNGTVEVLTREQDAAQEQ
jgi:dihydroxyacid dehydratase/phosphogluconate dehydratase